MLIKTFASLSVALAAFGAHAQLPESSPAAQAGSFLQVAADVGHRVIALATDDSAAVPAETDNVQITSSAPPIPEPETYALMAAGLAALAFVVRRRKG